MLNLQTFPRLFEWRRKPTAVVLITHTHLLTFPFLYRYPQHKCHSTVPSPSVQAGSGTRKDRASLLRVQGGSAIHNADAFLRCFPLKTWPQGILVCYSCTRVLVRLERL